MSPLPSSSRRQIAFNSAALSYTEMRLIQTFRSLSQDDQIRLLAIADALAPAMLQDEIDCIDEVGDNARLIDFRLCEKE